MGTTHMNDAETIVPLLMRHRDWPVIAKYMIYLAISKFTIDPNTLEEETYTVSDDEYLNTVPDDEEELIFE